MTRSSGGMQVRRYVGVVALATMLGGCSRCGGGPTQTDAGVTVDAGAPASPAVAHGRLPATDLRSAVILIYPEYRGVYAVAGRAWLERALPPSLLRMETFGNSGWFDAAPFTVRIPAIGLEARVEPHQSMLEALEAAGADMLSDCRKGECGLCEVRVLGLDGDIDHRDVFYSERQRDARSRLCCCVSRVVPGAAGDGVVTILTS